jgi:hypothetical protein
VGDQHVFSTYQRRAFALKLHALLENQISGMDVDLVAQIFAQINLSSSFADGKCAHCVSSPAAYQVYCHQISLLCQEVAEADLDTMGSTLNILGKDTIVASYAMAADWVLKNDYHMARLAAINGLLMDIFEPPALDVESTKKWAQEEKKLRSDRGLICFLNKKIPCLCLNEAMRQAKQNLPDTRHCMAQGCGIILPKTKLMKCSGCKISEYCSRKCQKIHWVWHKHFCKS